MKDRRKYVRIPESSQISYEVISTAKVSDFVTKDISQGGIRFLVNEFIPHNTFLKIRVTLERIHFCFEALVKLVWINEDPRSERFEVGVEFVNISEEAQQHLIDYINTIIKLK